LTKAAPSAAEFGGDFLRQPRFQIEGGIVEHLLAGRGIGIEITRGRDDLGKGGRTGARAHRCLADPARHRAAQRDQLAIVRRAGLHDLRDAADRADGHQTFGDAGVQFGGHGIATIGDRTDGHRLQLTFAALTQIAIDEALGFQIGAATGTDQRTRGHAVGAGHLRLHFLDIAAQGAQRLVRRVLTGHHVERGIQSRSVEGAGFLIFHKVFAFHTKAAHQAARNG
jgi:hypothetical protein